MSAAETDDLTDYKEGGDADNCGQRVSVVGRVVVVEIEADGRTRRMSADGENHAAVVGVEGTLEAAGGTETCSGRAAAAVDKKIE